MGIRKNPLPRASYAAHNCVVLAVDTAQVSGWAIMVRGVAVASGEFDLLKGTDGGALNVCQLAIMHASKELIRCVLVFERPFRGNVQGGYTGAWKMAWVSAGGNLRSMIGVYPATWRSRVLGSGSLQRDTARKREQLYAERVIGRACGPDESAAVCIATWASRAGEVLARLPRAEQKRQGMA